VAIINEAVARKFFPGREPLGQSITLYGASCEIVGVAGDVKTDRLDAAASAQTYQPFAQVSYTKAQFVVRTAGPAAGHIEAVRAVIARRTATSPSTTCAPSTPWWEIRSRASASP
jgi:hypothetical protein